MGEHPHGQVAHLGGVVIEGGQGLVPLEGGVAGAGLPGIVPDGAAPTGGVIEAEEAALLSPGAGGPEEGVLGADVPEDAVEHEGQAPGAAGLGETIEGGVVTQAGVDAQMVGGVVAVSGGGEDRPERQAVGAELDGVVEPGLQAVQARGGAGLGQGCARFGADGGAGGTQGVDLPPDGVVDPGGGCGTAYSR